MKCENCGTINFDVAITCVRCKRPIRSSSSQPSPLFRSNPEPEPPTQISDIGLQTVRFGPAPDEATPRAKRIRAPQSHNSQIPIRDRQPPPRSAEPKNTIPRKNPVLNQNHEPNHIQSESNNQPGVILFSVFLFSLGGTFLFLCLDFYALYSLLNT